MEKPLLSICIPTYERPELLKNTIQSIVSQPASFRYEICISDNSASDSVQDMMKYFSQENIVYQHIQPVGAYMNLLKALEMGNGKYLKLLNDYSMLNNGALQKILREIESADSESTVISWSNEDSRSYKGSDIDGFMSAIGINATWSICFGIWRKTFIELEKNIQVNEMFPHVSLLFGSIVRAKKIVVNNDALFENQELNKKGGYNIPDVFGRQYGELLDDLYNGGYISKSTIQKQKRDVIHFISEWKSKCLIDSDKYSYEFDRDKQIIKDTFGSNGLFIYYMLFVNYFFKGKTKRIINRIVKGM